MSPTGPSNVVGTSLSSNGTLQATVARDGRTVSAEAVATWAARGEWSTADAVEVSAIDTITAVNGGCPDRTITIGGAPGTLDVNTAYQKGLTCDALAPTMRVRTKGLLTLSPAFFYDINEICVADPNITNPDDPNVCIDAPPTGGGEDPGYFELSGTVASLKGSCPNVTMVVNGHRVTTSSTTEWPTGGCSSLRKGGTKVEVGGTYQPDGKLAASVVRITGQPGQEQ